MNRRKLIKSGLGLLSVFSIGAVGNDMAKVRAMGKVTIRLPANDGRLRSSPDLSLGDVIEWSDSGVQVYSDGSFSVASYVRSFQFRVKNKRWGKWATVGIS